MKTRRIHIDITLPLAVLIAAIFVSCVEKTHPASTPHPDRDAPAVLTETP